MNNRIVITTFDGLIDKILSSQPVEIVIGDVGDGEKRYYNPKVEVNWSVAHAKYKELQQNIDAAKMPPEKESFRLCIHTLHAMIEPLAVQLALESYKVATLHDDMFILQIPVKDKHSAMNGVPQIKEMMALFPTMIRGVCIERYIAEEDKVIDREWL
jgi:hypothetical protein